MGLGEIPVRAWGKAQGKRVVNAPGSRAKLMRRFVVAVAQRSGESMAVQELCAAEQGGRRELGFGAAAAMGMRRRGAAVRDKDTLMMSE